MTKFKSIKKSSGLNESENLLAELCEKTFLKLWSYANPYKFNGEELCDLLAVFENHIFIFCSRSTKFNLDKEISVAWERWKRTAITEQLPSSRTAKKYILQNPDKIYLDQKCTIPLPVSIPKENIVIHKIIVAHGAKEACRKFSKENIYGSLGIAYFNTNNYSSYAVRTDPFMVYLDKDDVIHIFDSHNLEIILSELDTYQDFVSYLTAKEQALKRHDSIIYCGEEDLLCNYLANIRSGKEGLVGVEENNKAVMIKEGGWKKFITQDFYKNRKLENKFSYLVWDKMIQKISQDAFDNMLLRGMESVFQRDSIIYEMAKEPRFSRRHLSYTLCDSIKLFLEKNIKDNYKIIFSRSLFYKETGYVFYQTKFNDIIDYSESARLSRAGALEAACGIIRNKLSFLKKIIGVTIDVTTSGKWEFDIFLMLDCENWPDEKREHFDNLNKNLKLFQNVYRQQKGVATEFPEKINLGQYKKINEDEPCFCESGKSFGQCCSFENQ